MPISAYSVGRGMPFPCHFTTVGCAPPICVQGPSFVHYSGKDSWGQGEGGINQDKFHGLVSEQALTRAGTGAGFQSHSKAMTHPNSHISCHPHGSTPPGILPQEYNIAMLRWSSQLQPWRSAGARPLSIPLVLLSFWVILWQLAGSGFEWGDRSYSEDRLNTATSCLDSLG
jgi:hypothetical protein